MAKLPVAVKSEDSGKQTVESTKERATVSPAEDIYETKTDLVMVVDMPGVSKEDTDIKVDNGIITITGQAFIPKGGDLRYWEFSPCVYHRSFALSPEIDQEKIGAEYKHGVLTIHMPKVERAKPRQIKVNVK